MRTLSHVQFVLCALILFGLSPKAANAGPVFWVDRGELLRPNPNPRDGFGRDVATFQSTIAVAAMGDDEAGSDAGAVYLYDGGPGLPLLHKFLPVLPSHDFGTALALDADTLAVARNVVCSGGSGAVDVFERKAGVWGPPQTLEPPPDVEPGCFGASLAIDGDLLVVSAKGYHDAGAVCVYARTSGVWGLQSILRGDPGPNDKDFGARVDVRADRIVVGNLNDSEAGPDNGSVDIFDGTGGQWVRTSRLLWPGAVDAEAMFGAALVLDGSNLFVSAPNKLPGEVLVYSNAGTDWNHETSIFDPGETYAVSALSLAAWSGTLLIGDETEGTSSSTGTTGAVWWLQRGSTGWTAPSPLDTTSPRGDWSFGTSVALHDGLAVVGAPGATTAGNYAGTAYVFELGTTLADDGESCRHPALCASGNCVDGVCCNDPCTGPCQSCTSALKGQGPDGVCGPAADGTDPDDDCVQAPGYPTSCGADGQCDGFGACRAAAREGIACGSTQCTEGTVAGQICDGTGLCVENGLADCFPYACNGDVCDTSCADGRGCAAGAECSSSGSCQSGVTCDGDHTLLLPDTTRVDCSPYRCLEDGRCSMRCSSVEDCVAPFVCNRANVCIELPPPPADTGGCGCTTAGSPASGLPPLLLAIVVLAAAGARRRSSFPAHRPAVAALVTTILTSPNASAAPGEAWALWGELQHDSVPDENFGAAVALRGDLLFVGAPVLAPFPTALPATEGTVYVYRRVAEGWELEKKLVGQRQRFGSSLDADESTLVVGSIQAGHALSIYSLTTGTPIHEADFSVGVLSSLPSSTPVAVHANMVAMGLPYSDDILDGAVAVYHKYGASWSSFTTIQRDAPNAANLRFGSHLSMDGDVLLVAAWEDTSSGLPSLNVYELDGLTWSPAGSLPLEWAPAGYRSVVVRDGVALVGVPALSGVKGEDVRVFSRAGFADWKETAILASACASQPDGCSFGYSVAFDGHTAIVGAPTGDIACAFERIAEGQWTQPTTLSAQAPSTAAQYGASVAIDGAVAVVGAPDDSHVAYGAGAAYVFTRSAVVGLGQACEADAFCSTGYCRDRVCCSTACDGICEACSVLKKGGGSEGTCGPVAADTDPDDDCAQDPAYPESCGGPGLCSGDGVCYAAAAEGTPCGLTACEAGFVVGRVCDGLGTCLKEGWATCAPYACESDRCATSCTTSEDCAAGAVCAPSEKCVSMAVCDGAHSVTNELGNVVNCSPYRCMKSGVCMESCNRVSDCVDPYVCDREHRCVALGNAPTATDGCGCRTTVASDRSSWFGLMLAVAALSWTRRRRDSPTAPKGCERRR